MTIDEAIVNEREKAKIKRKELELMEDYYDYNTIQRYKQYAEEHEQLAEWLEELKELRERKKEITIAEIKLDTEILQEIIDKKINEIELDIQSIINKAIDDFAERLCHKIKSEIDDCADELDWIDEIAEQLKEGVKE